MIHISIRNREEREEIEKQLAGKKLRYVKYFSGMRDDDIFRVKHGDKIVGRLSHQQFFLFKETVEIWVPWEKRFLRYVAYIKDYKGIPKHHVMFWGEEEEIW